MRPSLIRLAIAAEPPAMASIREGLKIAMRAKDSTTKNTLRSVMAAVTNANISKANSCTTDLNLYTIVDGLAQKRRESAAEYRKGSREDLAEGEEAELSVLEKLQAKIPVASDQEIRSKVSDYLATQGKNVPFKQLMSNLPDVEREWYAPKKSVVAAIKHMQQTRSYSTHSNPLGLRRRAAAGGVPQRKHIPNVANVILVSSAKGGVGKSTVATSLALAMYKRGHSTGILDADLFGPSIPKMLGLESALEPELTRDGRLVPLQNLGLKAMSMGFLIPKGKSLSWRGLLIQKALQQLLFEVDWGILDYLIIDMPPGTGDVQLTLCQQLHVDGAVMVSTPQDIALIDVARGADMFRSLGILVIGLVENMAYFECPCCHERTRIFGEMRGDSLGIPRLESLPLRPDITTGMDSGHPVTDEVFLSLADKVIAGLGS